MGGAFSWPDSPRHALNGAFVLDMLRALPYDDPVGYAHDYYSQYPALTILLYPPLFAFLLALSYFLFGVSQESALLVLFICYFILATGVYFLSRQWFNHFISFAIAVIFTSAPEIAFWGRQVMLEIPAFAFLVWSAYFHLRHFRSGRILYLYLSIALLVLAAYTKLSVIFVVIPYLASLLQIRGTAVFHDKHSYIIAALAIVGALPLIFLTIEFGQANLQSAMGIADSQASRLSIGGWIWYAKTFPSQLGWPASLAAIAAILIFVLDGQKRLQTLSRQQFLISWFVIGYLFFSSIDLKEARHSIFLLLPLAILAGYAYDWLWRKTPWLGGISIATVAILSFSTTVGSRPVLFVDGYRDVVDFVATKAPKYSNILFSGYRDGSFIFNMRAHSNRPDVSVIRADKLLLRISVRRGLGVEQKNFNEAEIAALIDKMAVNYVVAQPDFWTDLEQMARLQNVLHGQQFEELKRFKMRANYPAQEKELVVYRNLGKVAQGPINITNELPIINRSVSGKIYRGNAEKYKSD